MARSKSYTPHGYLANPHHCVKLGRSGVLRSSEPLGMALWYPNHPGMYGKQFGYCAEMNFAFGLGHKTFVRPSDLGDWHAPVHTSERFGYAAMIEDVLVTVTYALVRRGLLRAVVTLKNPTPSRRDVRVFLLGEYWRNTAFTGLWEEGILARVRDACSMELKSHPEGTAVVLAASTAGEYGACFKDLVAARKAIGQSFTRASGTAEVVTHGGGEKRVAGALSVRCRMAAGGSQSLVFSMAWSDKDKELSELLATPVTATRRVLADKQAADESFERDAVSISGDWPDHWRRGLQYDLQTLRMCILPPRGVFKHKWDAMQIQAPRFVFAETTFDMFLHGYSRAEEAQEIVLGSLLDAPEPWLPCIREDGSANMIAWNGHPCGTAPEWGAPEWVIERLYRRRPDPAWLAKVLDPFTAYLSWWDRHRTDKKGFAHYLCSYESGQDMSPRFNPQRGGGDDTRHCRAVDLQAAMARGWAFVAEARAQLGREADARTAARRAAHYRRRMEMLWSGDWYHDDNLKSRSASALYDVMHLAPFFYGLAATQRADAVRSRLMRLYQDKPQVWPTFMLMLAESTYRVGCSEMLSTMASERIAHIYAATDARRVTRTGPLPGVQHEYWPDRPAWGAEGYGWGTFGIALLVRYLAGWREEGQSLDDPGFTLAPALPTQLCRRGRVLHLHNLPALSRRFDLSYTVKPGGEMGLTVRMQRGKAVGEMQFLDASGNVLATACGKDPLQAVVRNHHRYRVVVKSLENMRKGKKKSEQLHRQ